MRFNNKGIAMRICRNVLQDTAECFGFYTFFLCFRHDDGIDMVAGGVTGNRFGRLTASRVYAAGEGDIL